MSAGIVVHPAGNTSSVLSFLSPSLADPLLLLSVTPLFEPFHSSSSSTSLPLPSPLLTIDRFSNRSRTARCATNGTWNFDVAPRGYCTYVEANFGNCFPTHLMEHQKLQKSLANQAVFIKSKETLLFKELYIKKKKKGYYSKLFPTDLVSTEEKHFKGQENF